MRYIIQNICVKLLLSPDSLDATPPVVTCPDDIRSEVPIGTSFRRETWALPTVTDNSGSFFLVSSNYDPNDVFQVGETIVTYTYRDAANNVNSCSFTIMIVEGKVCYFIYKL